MKVKSRGSQQICVVKTTEHASRYMDGGGDTNDKDGAENEDGDEDDDHEEEEEGEGQ